MVVQQRHVFPGVHPALFLVSIALHAALLFVVIPRASQRPKLQAITEVEITDLVTPKDPIASAPSRSQPLKADIPAPRIESPVPTIPTPVPSVSSAPQTPSIPTPSPIPTSTTTPRSNPIPTPTATATPSPIPTSTITPTPSALPSPSPTPMSTTSSPASGAISNFFEQLASDGSGTIDRPPSPDLFADPRLFFDRVTPAEQATLKPEILRAIAISGKTPVQVYVEILVTQAQRSNFQVMQGGNYGGGTVYEVRQGRNLWYFNLVPTKNADGTIIVVWQRDPGVPLQ